MFKNFFHIPFKDKGKNMRIYTTVDYNRRTELKNKAVKAPVSFSSNPNSHILEFTYNDFFVNIKGYGRNKQWAKEVRQIADSAVKKIKNDRTSDDVLTYIADGIRTANRSNCLDIKKKTHSGILRTHRKGYGSTGSWENRELVTPVDNQYAGYTEKLRPLESKPLNSPFSDIDLAKIEFCCLSNDDIRIVHPSGTKVNNALDRVGGKFFNLKKDYISKPENVTTATLPQINSDIAEIRWIMAHSMPWERGSDAISNVFMRSLYKSMGIKTYPLKQGISLDLEAFCTPLNEYKANFTSYFETEPHITY